MQLDAEAVDADISLEKSSIVLNNAYITLSSLGTTKIVNNSDILVNQSLCFALT